MHTYPIARSVGLVIAIAGAGVVAACGAGENQILVPAEGGCRVTSCGALGVDCGRVPDGCGGVMECGACGAGSTCGAAGPNRCGVGTCTARTCATANASCGSVSDGCSDVLQCGTCAAPATCGGGGTPNQCGGGRADAGTCATGSGFDLLAAPAPGSLLAGGAPSFADLVPTSSGLLFVSDAAHDLAATPISASGAAGATKRFATGLDTPAIHAFPGCGGAVAAAVARGTSAPTGLLAVLANDGTVTKSFGLGAITGGFNLFGVAIGPDAFALSVNTGLSSYACTGAARFPTIPLANLRPSDPCAGTCSLRQCANDGAGHLACVATEWVTAGFLSTEKVRSVVVVDPTSGRVLSSPTKVFQGIEAFTQDLTSCGPSCFELLVGTSSGGYVQRLGGDGKPSGAPRALSTQSPFIQAKRVNGPDFIALITGGPGEATLYPKSVWVFDTSWNPLVPDSLGRATPTTLATNVGGCPGSGVYAGGAVATGGARLVLAQAGLASPSASCTESVKSTFYGCKP